MSRGSSVNKTVDMGMTKGEAMSAVSSHTDAGSSLNMSMEPPLSPSFAFSSPPSTLSPSSPSPKTNYMIPISPASPGDSRSISKRRTSTTSAKMLPRSSGGGGSSGGGSSSSSSSSSGGRPGRQELMPQGSDGKVPPSRISSSPDAIARFSNYVSRRHGWETSYISPSTTSNAAENHRKIAGIVKSPPGEIAKEIHKRDSSISALRRNLEHETRRGEKVAAELDATRKALGDVEYVNKTLRQRLEFVATKAANAHHRRRSTMRRGSPLTTVADSAPKNLGDVFESASSSSSSSQDEREKEELEDLKNRIRDTEKALELSSNNNKKLRNQVVDEARKTSELNNLNAKLTSMLKEEEDKMNLLKKKLASDKKIHEVDEEELKATKTQLENMATNADYLKNKLEKERQQQVRSSWVVITLDWTWTRQKKGWTKTRILNYVFFSFFCSHKRGC